MGIEVHTLVVLDEKRKVLVESGFVFFEAEVVFGEIYDRVFIAVADLEESLDRSEIII